MEYIIGKRQVVMNFSEKFCKTENEVLSSDCFADVWGKYVKHLYQTENQAFLKVLKVLFVVYDFAFTLLCLSFLRCGLHRRFCVVCFV